MLWIRHLFSHQQAIGDWKFSKESIQSNCKTNRKYFLAIFFFLFCLDFSAEDLDVDVVVVVRHRLSRKMKEEIHSFPFPYTPGTSGYNQLGNKRHINSNYLAKRKQTICSIGNEWWFIFEGVEKFSVLLFFWLSLLSTSDLIEEKNHRQRLLCEGKSERRNSPLRNDQHMFIKYTAIIWMQRHLNKKRTNDAAGEGGRREKTERWN